jgi:hypothetical protein
MINWHRLFGIFLVDYFTDTPYLVELEKDLSLTQQLLDVVVIKKESGEFQATLPDGLENLTTHNLLSYKSMRESFDSWAIHELIGHYVTPVNNCAKNYYPNLNLIYTHQHPFSNEFGEINSPHKIKIRRL